MPRKLKVTIFVCVGMITLLCLTQVGGREKIPFEDPQGVTRNALQGKEFMVVAGTPFSANAGYDVLANGGNAADAAVASLLALNVTFSEASSFPSVAPMLYYDANTSQIESYIGAGKAPNLATIEYFKSNGYDAVPKMSILAQLIPASPDVITLLLKKRGTKSFTELAKPSIELARNGFPVLKTTEKNLGMNIFKRAGYTFLMPYNSKVFLGDHWWHPLKQYDKIQLTDLANTLEELSNAEQEALHSGKNRTQALDAVRDYFYKGPIAQKIAAFHKSSGGLIRLDDLANYSGGLEKPLVGSFRDISFYTNDTWNQGIVVLMTLQILDNVDFTNIQHNSPEYIHLVTQAIELAMSDRETFVGDPAFASVPINGLLHRAYAKERFSKFSSSAFGQTPPSGDPWKFETRHRVALSTQTRSSTDQFTASKEPQASKNSNESRKLEKSEKSKESKESEKPENFPFASAISWNGNIGKDTSYISIVDAKGNAVSLTPSDFPMSPMIPDTGLTLGIRMTQFKLDQSSPTSLAPGKRPRITPHALMAMKNGKLYMSFGTPGGEMQTQALVQIVLNHIVYGMDIQKAIEAPRFRSRNWPDSFSPHEYFPGQLDLEEELFLSNGDAMKEMGYNVTQFPSLDNQFSAPGAIVITKDGLVGGADPRESTLAKGR